MAGAEGPTSNTSETGPPKTETAKTERPSTRTPSTRTPSTRTVAVFGASGYAGTELLRLLASHPNFKVVAASAGSHEGTAVADAQPALAAAYPGLRYSPIEAGVADGVDMVFCALPHGASQQLVPKLLGHVGHVVDLAADFRLKDQDLYPLWYHEEHSCPELLAEAVFGLPELDRQGLFGARLVAAPGCYVTAATLALAPLVKAGAVGRTGIVVDAASGVSGAGRKLAESTQFCTVDEDFTAYGLLTHRHTPEMEQAIGAQLIFTPHLAPMNRGILATCYGRPNAGHDDDPLDILARTYAGEPFLVVSGRSPSTKATLGSNTAHLTARFDERTGWVVAICALDNLVKGAAGQAVQCANAVMGWPETTGLPTAGLAP
ncbi:MAG TPA: N-acetyl-gamma-glutamyl-phosphate reductase [Acidimicrobiales bacterium]|nr:N-acetyl-gamma-glutamyl-phosphate reductase [Acidimicrobiales bacterium]